MVQESRCSLRPIGLVSRGGKSADTSTWTNHVGPISVFDGKADYDINWKDLDQKGSKSFGSVSGWLGFTDKYWLTALVPTGSCHWRFPQQPERRLPGRLRRRAGQRRARPDGYGQRAPVRWSEGEGVARPLRGRRHPQAFEVDRLGLVRMVHAADLRSVDVPVPHRRQLRRRDHLPHAHRPRW